MPRGRSGLQPARRRVNGIIVTSKSDVPTWFGRIIGISKMKVSAKATACSPCAVKPLDIMIVLDRTGSMCQIGPRVSQPRRRARI